MTYKLLGKGAYGCVISPPITNNIVSTYDTYDSKKSSDIGKIFHYDENSYAEKEFLKELDIARKINKIDIDSEFTVKLKGANTIMINKDTVIHYELGQCLNISTNHDYKKVFFQIIYENGGKTLIDEKKIIYKTFIKQFKNLLLGLEILHNNNVVHFDIKVDNIVINEEKMRFIDFGVSPP